MEQSKKGLLVQVGNYWNTRAEGYSLDVKEELLGESGKDWLSFIKEIAPKEKFSKVLDIGCGPGFFVTLLGRAGYEVTGVDYTENMLIEARRNTTEHGVEARLLRMDVQELDFTDECFDLLVTRNVTWNLEHPMEAYKEWLRVLKPGGILINADGNHYLHYTDETYAKSASESEHKHMEGIDVSVIDNLARELPLSREHRPAWDQAVLESLGATDFVVRKEVTEQVAGRNGETRDITRNFIFTVGKKA
ncbi:MAG: class I SAM-dependent methyltransferase [Lachnospiraceae bacterium]|nr:class I SAM-dependent methyltransferase [Lachnospiraceae bacterium]